MIAATLRQHRLAILGTTVAVALATVLLWRATARDGSVYGSLDQYLLYIPTVLGGLFAVFWAAPLLTREYENRTHLFAWGQDVSPVRWLAGKVVVLAGIAAGLSAITGAVAQVAVADMFQRIGRSYPFDAQAFDSNACVMAAHTLFGFALGLLAGTITRHTLPAMGLTLFFFVGVRGLVSVFWRPYYITPVHGFQALKPPGEYVQMVPSGGWRIDSGYADAAGNPLTVPPQCDTSRLAYEECLRANGVAGHFADFQTADRVATFQLIETGLYLGFAAILFVIAFVWVRRVRRV